MEIENVFTIISKENEGYFRLLVSAKRWGWKLRTVFIPNDGSEAAYWDFIQRKHLYIKKEVLRKELFLYVDGYDTIFIGPPVDVETKNVIFSAQDECWPEPGYGRYFPGRFLNTGVIYGKTSVYYQRCPEYVGVNDQLVWTREYLNDSTNLVVDCDSQFSHTSFPETSAADWSHIGGIWRYNPKGSFPVVFHAAGKSAMPAFFL